MRITLDSPLSVEIAPGQRREIPPVRMDGFVARSRYHGLLSSMELRLDSGEAAVLQRSLDFVAAKATQVMYPELRAARFVPNLGEIPLGARTFTYAVQDRFGVAERVTGNGKALPRANTTLSENTGAIVPYGAMYAYTTEELRAFSYAAGTGRGPALSIDTERAVTAQLMIARKIDNVIAFGDASDSRVKGFLNDSGVTVSTAAINWNIATYAELLAELLALANNPFIVSKETFKPDTILLPTDYLTLVQSVMNPLGSKSVLSAFMDAMRDAGRSVSVESWPLLATADAAGTGPRAVSYVRDVDVVASVVPAMFIAQPPQAVGLEWQIPCEGICGGTAIRKPLGVYYRDGLNG